jgi:hypothetical protein
MKKYNYYYNGEPITRKQFITAVPENWQSEVINGEYSYGYFKAVEGEE